MEVNVIEQWLTHVKHLFEGSVLGSEDIRIIIEMEQTLLDEFKKAGIMTLKLVPPLDPSVY